MTTQWMNDESLKHIEPYKLEFLQALVFESSNLRKEQLMPFLMNIAKRSKEKNISFSDEEIDAVVAVLKKQASPEELSKMEKILAMRAKR
ncbi:MAG: hypothetical protein IJD96_10915 [Lachnospiraceae bacterium]|nr:hypothetical protein [Lachnospiraceae bacterium]